MILLQPPPPPPPPLLSPPPTPPPPPPPSPFCFFCRVASPWARRPFSSETEPVVRKSFLTLACMLQLSQLAWKKTLTVCSLYLPPNSPVSKLSLAELFEQLPKPFLVLRDFNAHSPAWGDFRRDGRGRVFEEFTAENDLIILNSGEQTFVHLAYHSTSAIDLAVASFSIAAECSWAAHSDKCGSDHFPIFLTLSSNFSSNVNTSFNFLKADWNRF
ncbi:RNA-directed DNA polymerase from mobile element jockey [Plakobranchus ocellatus]|uniref:RNA-directed DNA polymerase from mobile element jockey n=1 Tax=Plakobranchus ocellatus TaxID=259542 RepID=A0AAV4BKC0_9GAST|nr:RNA-directed DNA polymerase from mobile element jockey [Plakobranchus ocellatus]